MVTFRIAIGSAGIGRLPRRQEMPEDAYISVKELKEMYGEGNSDNVLPIIAISYCWLTPGHPDPDGSQLATVAAALQGDKHAFEDFGFPEMGVFWDWLSLYQRDNSLWKNSFYKPDEKLKPDQRLAKQSYYNSRTMEESLSIQRALTETMDLWCACRSVCLEPSVRWAVRWAWRQKIKLAPHTRAIDLPPGRYAHLGTTTYMLVDLPRRYQNRRTSYDDSGW